MVFAEKRYPVLRYLDKRFSSALYFTTTSCGADKTFCTFSSLLLTLTHIVDTYSHKQIKIYCIYKSERRHEQRTPINVTDTLSRASRAEPKTHFSIMMDMQRATCFGFHARPTFARQTKLSFSLLEPINFRPRMEEQLSSGPSGDHKTNQLRENYLLIPPPVRVQLDEANFRERTNLINIR